MATASGIKIVLTPIAFGTDAPTTTLSYELAGGDSWIEIGAGGITWNNRPTTGTVLTTGLANFTVGVPMELDVTASARAQAAGDGLFTLRIRSTTPWLQSDSHLRLQGKCHGSQSAIP